MQLTFTGHPLRRDLLPLNEDFQALVNSPQALYLPLTSNNLELLTEPAEGAFSSTTKRGPRQLAWVKRDSVLDALANDHVEHSVYLGNQEGPNGGARFAVAVDNDWITKNGDSEEQR